METTYMLKKRLRSYLRRHPSARRQALSGSQPAPSGHQPMLPAGTVDTAEYYARLKRDLEQLDVLLGEDPDAFRKMMLASYYRSGESPDFDKPIPAYMYKARVCNIYLLQYYIMYRLLIPVFLETKAEEMKLLVLGCGSMIDSFSLSYAMKEFGNSFTVRYTGVDIAEWPENYKTSFETYFIRKPMQDYWDDIEVFDGNIIFFATVLSELREYPDEMERFCRGLEKTPFTSDTIFLMVSYRSIASYKRDWRLTDWQKVQMVINELEKKGYKAGRLPVSLPAGWSIYLRSEEAADEAGRGWPCYYLSAPDGSDGVISMKEAAPDFAMPDFVEEYLENPGYIRRHCSNYQKRREQYLKRNPEKNSEEENPSVICREECPIICNPAPRVLHSNKFSTCFQIFVFHRSSSE